jgi:hypothetical protein
VCDGSKLRTEYEESCKLQREAVGSRQYDRGRWALGAEVTRDNGGFRGVLCCAVRCKLAMPAVVDGSGGVLCSEAWARY